MPNNYILLDRIELNATAASVTFDNIPQSGYTDLKIVISGRDDRASQTNGDIALRVSFNGTVNTGSIYSQRRLYGSPGTGAGSDSTSGTSLPLGMLTSSTATANTFGNTEFYIPNYRSSSNKSVSCDGVSENNGTVAFQVFNAGLIATSNPITGIVLFSNLGTNLLANSTFSLYGLAQVGTTPAIAPKANGGNVIGTDGTYWYHAFLSNGTFTPQVGLTCDVLTIAGGGGGGYAGNGGSGGAGGVVYQTARSLTTSPINVTVGGGGASPNPTSGPGANGVNSTFDTITALGGGGGGGNNGTPANYTGRAGGSGGGGVGDPGSAGGSATQGSSGGGTGYGFAGGSGANAGFTSSGSGGGGGAGGAGGNATTIRGGDAGLGLNTWSAWATATGTGVSGYYASGGAGGGGGPGTSNGTTALGGGGGPGLNTVINTGGGAGGGGNGASGIVIVRYLVA